MKPLPQNEDGERNCEDDAASDDEVRSEPVFLFSLVQHDLQRTHGDDEKREADVVECEEILFVGLGVWWIFDEPLREKKVRMPTGTLI